MAKNRIVNVKSNIVSILSNFRKVTEKEVLQIEYLHMENMVSLGELATSMAHEINNSVTGIINCSQLLVNKSMKGSKENDIANRITKEGNRIAHLVNNLLCLSRPGDRKEEKYGINMYEMLPDTLILIHAQLKKEGIILSLDIPAGLPEIFVNPYQIQQVFLNILSNARYALNQKYPEAHENKILEILAEEIMIDDCPFVKVIFYDHGTGIPAHTINKVMSPFFTTKPKGKGTGLGLSISNEIIIEHGGKLKIDSAEGKFTKVIITLPALK